MNEHPRIIVVAGYNRCGSTTVMQMLAAGGCPMTGEWPAYAVEESLELTADWLAEHDGMAVKVLDPHKHPFPVGPDYRVIWLDRNSEQQARSQAKFLGTLVNLRLTDADIQRFRQSYRAERPKVMALFRSVGATVLAVRFEMILLSPQTAAAQIAGFVGGLDAAAMAQVVLPRTPECRPDLAIEMLQANFSAAAMQEKVCVMGWDK